MDIYQLVAGTELEQFLGGMQDSNVDERGGSWHVTIYASGGHISADVDGRGNAWNVHSTIHDQLNQGEDINIDY